MANSNGSRTIQCDENLIKEITILAIQKDKTRREIIDEALKEYLEKYKK
jgi:predicted transcriptional regulator